MSDTAAATGTRTLEIDHGGTTWTLGPVTAGVQGKFASWLESTVLRATQRLMGRLGTDDAGRAWRAFVEAVAIERRYEWDGEACRQALNTPGGKAQLVYLCLQKAHPGVKPADAEALVVGEWAAVNAALAAFNPSLYTLPGDGSAVEDGRPKADPGGPGPPAG
jgi:hypothetical protein